MRFWGYWGCLLSCHWLVTTKENLAMRRSTHTFKGFHVLRYHSEKRGRSLNRILYIYSSAQFRVIWIILRHFFRTLFLFFFYKTFSALQFNNVHSLRFPKYNGWSEFVHNLYITFFVMFVWIILQFSHLLWLFLRF